MGVSSVVIIKTVVFSSLLYYHDCNVWTLQWWHKFWRSWAPVPTLFGITIFIFWQYSRKLQHRYINDTCSTASQLEIQCYRTIPLRFLSRSWGKLAQVQIPTPFRRFFYLTFSKTYGINLDEVKDDLSSYASLGEFFIRHLRHGVRPIAQNDMVSPADGTVLNCGRVTSCCVEQVKGTTYLIKSFLGENNWSVGKSTLLTESVNVQSSRRDVAFVHSMNSHPVQDLNRNEYFTTILKQDFLDTAYDLDMYETSNSTGGTSKHNYGKTKCKNFEVEIPVVPKILDYYVKDLLSTCYSSVALLMYKNTLPNLFMSLAPDNYNSMSPVLKGSGDSVSQASSTSVSKPTICTPSAEEEWREYKRHLLNNPTDNDLYQLIVYLAPGDYHRFHSPAETSIKYRRHFQGDLLSVNPCVACWIPDLFVLNERAAYMGSWKHGFFSMVMVGATNVGSIKVHSDETLLTNSKRWPKGIRHKDLEMSANWKKGAEVGEFRMGSTVVLLFEAPKTFEFNVTGGDKVKVGQSLMRE